MTFNFIPHVDGHKERSLSGGGVKGIPTILIQRQAQEKQLKLKLSHGK